MSHENRYTSNHPPSTRPLTTSFRVTLRCRSPVSRISVEILCSIFSFSKSDLRPHLGSFDVHRQNISILRLTAVCRYWRSVAIDYAILWRNIAFTTTALHTIDCATIFLQRSKGTPLYVHIWDIPRPGHLHSHKPPRDVLAHLLSLISSQRNRIVLLELMEPSTHLFDAFRGPAENVSRLIVHGRTPIKRSDTFSAKFPNVQQITLISPTPCRLGTLASLTQVILHNGSRGWNIDAFLDCVDGCSSLRSLSIVRYLDFDQGRNSTKTVSLPSLVSIRLDTCDAATILSHLDLPTTVSVSICINTRHAPGNFDNIFSCMPSEITRVNFLQNTRSLTLVFDKAHGDFHVSGFNGATPVFLLQVCGPLVMLDDDWVRRSFAAATQTLPFSGITSLTLVAESTSIPWESWLCRFCHLTTLDARCTDLKGLAEALNCAENDVTLCPTLKDLSIEVPRRSWFRHENLLESAILLRKASGSALSSLTVNADEWKDTRRLNPTWACLVRREGLWLNLP